MGSSVESQSVFERIQELRAAGDIEGWARLLMESVWELTKEERQSLRLTGDEARAYQVMKKKYKPFLKDKQREERRRRREEERRREAHERLLKMRVKAREYGRRWAHKKAERTALKLLYDHQNEAKRRLSYVRNSWDAVKALAAIMDPNNRHYCLWLSNTLGATAEEHLKDAEFAARLIDRAVGVWKRKYQSAFEHLQSLRDAGDVMGFAKLNREPIYGELAGGRDSCFPLTPDEARAIEQVWKQGRLAKQRELGTMHKQAYIAWGDMEADVDEELAPLILALWKAGIETCNSCQEQPWSGEVWIQFDNYNGAKAFLKMVAKESLMEDGQTKGRKGAGWNYEIDTNDLLRQLQVPEIHKSFRCSVRFPRKDLQSTIERVERQVDRSGVAEAA